MKVIVMARLIVPTVVFFVASSLAYPAIAADDERLIYGINEGAVVVLHQPLTIGTGDHQAFIQGGGLKSDSLYSASPGYNQYYPFCFFEIRSPSEQQQTISPGEFEIIRVMTEETEFVQAKPVRVAGRLQLAGSLSPIVQVLILKLRSSSQPNVEQLVCADGFADPNDVILPTLEQIKKTLGKVATLKLVQ